MHARSSAFADRKSRQPVPDARRDTEFHIHPHALAAKVVRPSIMVKTTGAAWIISGSIA